MLAQQAFYFGNVCSAIEMVPSKSLLFWKYFLIKDPPTRLKLIPTSFIDEKMIKHTNKALYTECAKLNKEHGRRNIVLSLAWHVFFHRRYFIWLDFILSTVTNVFSLNSSLLCVVFFNFFYFYWEIKVDFTALRARLQFSHCPLHCYLAPWLTFFEGWGVCIGEWEVGKWCFHLNSPVW